VIDDGVIVEQGPHDELMRRRGPYYELWQRHGLVVAAAAAALPED
jgi:ABC-type multidrug transport system fused ATPase/permease subunit